MSDEAAEILAEAIRDAAHTIADVFKNENGDANITDAVYFLCDEIRRGYKHLGKEDASDSRGCLEFLAGEIKDGLERLSGAVDGLRPQGE